MDLNNEDIETIVQKTHCTQEKAKETLEKFNGDVVDAIIDIERNKSFNDDSKMKDLKERIKNAIKKGNVTKIQITRDDKMVLSIPVNVGILGIAAAPWTVIFGAIAAYGFDYEFSIVKDDGTIEKL